ncbi:MAG TPA: GNAT family N-acetyltransferase [Bacilli bacterium]|nr:GNAT family N-acetyltransferase [Bacilli bacterium]
MDNQSSFRRAQEKDLKEIVELCEFVKKTYPLWNEYYPIYDNFLEDYQNNLLFVLEVSGKIIGSIGAEKSNWHENTLTLHLFMIHPEYRNQGYGTKLFQNTEKLLAKEGETQIDLLVRNDNVKAMKMYRTLGYQNLGPVKTPWETEDGKFYFLFVKRISKQEKNA